MVQGEKLGKNYVLLHSEILGIFRIVFQRYRLCNLMSAAMQILDRLFLSVN